MAQHNNQSETTVNYSLLWIALLAFLTGVSPLSMDMYLPAFPTMATYFHTSVDTISYTLPAFFAGITIGQLIYGPISDRIGRKIPLYIGLTIYIIFSLMCIWVEHEWALIISRIFQAFGGCVGGVIARAAIRDRLDAKQAAKAMAQMMVVMGLTPVLAPSFGVFMLHHFGWESIFYLLAAIGVLLLLAVHFTFDETLDTSKRLPVTFKHATQLYITVMRDEKFVLPMLVGNLFGAALFCYINSVSAILTVHFHLTPQQVAWSFAFNAVGFTSFALLNTWLLRHFKLIQVLHWGVLIQSIAAVALFILALTGGESLILTFAILFFLISGIGFTGPNAAALAMSQQGHRAGTASALLGSLQFFAGLVAGILVAIFPWSTYLNTSLATLMFAIAGFVLMFKLNKSEVVKAYPH